MLRRLLLGTKDLKFRDLYETIKQEGMKNYRSFLAGLTGCIIGFSAMIGSTIYQIERPSIPPVVQRWNDTNRELNKQITLESLADDSLRERVKSLIEERS